MEPKRLSRTAIYEDPWVNLYADRVLFPGGRIIEKHHVIEFDRAAVAAIVLDSQDRLLFVHSYRYCVHATTWELPAGGIEENESILEAARREVYEETGYESASHELLYTYWPMNGISNKVFHVTRCQAKDRTGTFDANEVQDVKWFSTEEIKSMIRSGDLKDGYTLVSLLLHFGISAEP